MDIDCHPPPPLQSALAQMGGAGLRGGGPATLGATPNAAIHPSALPSAISLPMAMSAAAAAAAAAGLPLPPAAAAAAVAAQAAPADPARPFVCAPMGRGAVGSLAAWRARRGVALDVSCLPGIELLSARERELCASARLLPPQYLALKDMLLRDSAQHGGISRADAKNFFRLEPSRALRIYELQV